MDEIRNDEINEEEASETPEAENDLDLGTEEDEDDPFAAPKPDEEDLGAHGLSVEDEGSAEDA